MCLAKAEEKLQEGYPLPCVAWDSVQERAVLLLNDCVPTVGLWAAMYAHELGWSQESLGSDLGSLQRIHGGGKRRKVGPTPHIERADPYRLSQSHILRKERIGAMYNMDRNFPSGYVWMDGWVDGGLEFFFSSSFFVQGFVWLILPGMHPVLVTIWVFTMHIDWRLRPTCH